MGSRHGVHGKSDVPHPLKQLMSSCSLNILRCSLNHHLAQVSGEQLAHIRESLVMSPLPACLSPCLYFPLSIRTWAESLALWLRLLLHSFFWGIVFVSFLVTMIKYSDKSHLWTRSVYLSSQFKSKQQGLDWTRFPIPFLHAVPDPSQGRVIPTVGNSSRLN